MLTEMKKFKKKTETEKFETETHKFAYIHFVSAVFALCHQRITLET